MVSQVEARLLKQVQLLNNATDISWFEISNDLSYLLDFIATLRASLVLFSVHRNKSQLLLN